MKSIARALLLVAFLVAGSIAQADAGWKRFDFDQGTTHLDPYGNTVFPKCSGAPVLTIGPYGPELAAAETQYSIFYREGDYRKLAIFFDGGGACWDELTCLGSAIAGNPIYDTVVDETVAELNATGGLADNTNPDNPIAGYFQVFIPYCTADLHIGTQTTVYDYDGLYWPINHTGRDNVAAALGWLVQQYQGKAAPGTVVIAGSSAGGYGAMVNYPAIHKLLPGWAKKRVFVDSANGIINQDFYDRALEQTGVWGARNGLAPEIENAFAAGPDALPTALNQSLGWTYPRTRFGQYTQAFDGVQIFYLNVAKYLDNPELWDNPLLVLLTGLEWTTKARANMLFSALTTFNYRFYFATGSAHTIVPEDAVYSEMSGSGILLTDWLYDMINRRWLFGSDWRNATCAPNCAP
jgi:hypothetical protein